MKYLSFITALILLVTLFSFVFAQLNKDETKHEYGIAFPLENAESRLPPLSSIEPLESKAAAPESSSEPTTTTETIATSKAAEPGDSQPTSSDGTSVMELIKPDQDTSDEPNGSNGASIVIETIQDTIVPANETAANTESDKDSSEEEPMPGTNPKLVFIERLMGLNFQRASPFLADMNRDEEDSKSNATKPDSSAEDTSAENTKDQESLPWAGTLDSLRSRWENRIRKFTYPFQNSYSVVLRASSVGADENSAKDNNPQEVPLADSDSDSELKRPNMIVGSQEANSPNKYYGIQSMVEPVSPPGMQSPNNQGQANQLLRMAALSMMSKLFSALRNQVYTNQKLDSGRFSADHDHAHYANSHELDLDDDESDDAPDAADQGSVGPETGLPVPIIIAHRPRIMPEPEQEPAMHRAASIMYGRPGPAAAYQGPTSRGLPSFLGGRPYPRQMMMAEQPSEPQPQRLVLLITHRPEASSPRVKIVSPRDEQPSYPQPMFHYAPLSPPASPISYQMQAARPRPSLPAILQAIQQAQMQQQAQQVAPQPQATRIVEVPVPVYVPMMVRQPPRPSRQIARAMMAPAPEQPQTSGPVALVYVHQSDNQQEASQDAPNYPSQPEAVEPEMPMGGVIRFMLRSRPGPVAPSPIARMAFHRRLDESEQDADSAPSPMTHHDMIDGPRLRQWRDYSQFVRSAPAPIAPHQSPSPVAHFLVASRAPHEESEPASSEEHYHHQSPHHFFVAANNQQQGSQEVDQQSPIMAPYGGQQQPQAAAFFIVAEPHGAQQEQNNRSQES